jgi:hypothetical protein
MSKSQGQEQLKGLGKLKKFNYLIGSRTRNLAARSIVPQPSTSGLPDCYDFQKTDLKKICYEWEGK